MAWWVYVILFFVVFGGGGALFDAQKGKWLRTMPAGSTRVVTVKATRANGKIKEYSKAGWTMCGQRSSKSFLSEAQVTLTFQKL